VAPILRKRFPGSFRPNGPQMPPPKENVGCHQPGLTRGPPEPPRNLVARPWKGVAPRCWRKGPKRANPGAAYQPNVRLAPRNALPCPKRGFSLPEMVFGTRRRPTNETPEKEEPTGKFRSETVIPPETPALVKTPRFAGPIPLPPGAGREAQN